MTATFTGRLLVAAPSLRDPNFERAVVLVVAHGEEGALGVVLNRPSETSVSEILPRWEHLAAEPSVVFLGGPVAVDGVICLGRTGSAQGTGTGLLLLAGLETVDLEGGDPLPVGDIRVFAGHAGWGPTQLEDEVEAGAWFVVDAVADDALAPAPEELWPEVLRRQGGALARLANFPDDPTTN